MPCHECCRKMFPCCVYNKKRSKNQGADGKVFPNFGCGLIWSCSCTAVHYDTAPLRLLGSALLCEIANAIIVLCSYTPQWKRTWIVPCFLSARLGGWWGRIVCCTLLSTSNWAISCFRGGQNACQDGLYLSSDWQFQTQASNGTLLQVP